MRWVRTQRKAWTFRIILVICIVGIVAASSYLGWQAWKRYTATHDPHPTIQTQVVTHSTENPDETDPKEACANYSVDAALPKRINLPTINEGGCIEHVGLDQHGAIAVPSNIHVAGWYTDSALPGQDGVAIIDGHINGNYTSDGIFQHLQDIKKDDVFTVTRGDDTTLHYNVKSVQLVPLDDVSQVLFKKSADEKSQLNLITCGGKWDEKVKQFDHRVIVIAELAGE